MSLFLLRDCRFFSTPFFSGNQINNFHGKAITKLLDIAGYDILALGNHEFDNGSGILGEAIENTNFTTLCTDLNIKGTALEGTCKQSYIKEFNDIRIGFFSLMTPEFPHVTNGGNVSLNGTTFEIAKEMVQKLRQKNVAVIIAVTHLGTDLDRLLATKVDGIDVIFGGHSHDYLPQLETINNTLIVNGGEKGSALVQLNIPLDTNNRPLPDTAVYSLIPVSTSVAEDPEVAKQLGKFTALLPKSVVLGTTDREWHLDKHSLRSQESSVADLINDLILEKFQVDLVLNNSGAFRGNKVYPAGSVTDTMLHEIDAFDNDIYLVKIKGRYLLEILEHSAASLGTGEFLQLAGARMKILTTGTKQQIKNTNKQWQVTLPGKQITSVQIRNSDGSYSPLNLEKEYSIATNAFLAQHGGGQYFWFSSYGRENTNTFTTLYSIMAMTIHHKKILNPPMPDGRILITTEK